MEVLGKKLEQDGKLGLEFVMEIRYIRLLKEQECQFQN
jgi:hypothetical protein